MRHYTRMSNCVRPPIIHTVSINTVIIIVTTSFWARYACLWQLWQIINNKLSPEDTRWAFLSCHVTLADFCNLFFSMRESMCCIDIGAVETWRVDFTFKHNSQVELEVMVFTFRKNFKGFNFCAFGS